jgi:antitoxin component of MazEF toxin-antitoxin module
MGRKAKIINPSIPQPAKVFRHTKCVAVSIPVHMAKYLGLYEYQSTLEVRVEDGKLVYTPRPTEPAFGFTVEQEA